MNRNSLVLMVVAVLVATACGSAGQHLTAKGTGARTAASSVAPAAMTGGPFAMTVADSTGVETLRLLDLSGHVVASTQFAPPERPVYGPCATILQPPVRVAAGAVYFADKTGLVRKLSVTGSVSDVATFALTSPQQALSFAVSPDGSQLIATVFTAPPLHNPPPQRLGDPFLDPGSWTLDLETAVAGGRTNAVLHRTLAGLPPAPTEITGWDTVGPTAVLNSWICTQNGFPSWRYTSGTLVHLGLDGAHLERIGGADCTAWDELVDGTVLCGGRDDQSFTVRTRSGSTIWSGGGGSMEDVQLSPDASAVTSAGEGTIYLRDSVHRATGARTADPQSQFAGWAGASTVLVLRGDGHIGVAPATDPSMFSDLGLTVGKTCPTCGFYDVRAYGTISS